ncbi:MAG: AAA family ATPase, partial [Candidatus Dormibacteraeota bacterium]|nr:AAA family ATPase [Candidatus Dormibacteraeota bacterium]MBO0762827.1 AAA family ATPase [Candidatus Dormibacteraeota bacterium]
MSHDLTRAGSELIGRERELGVLEAWLQRPTGARVIFNYGERGIGKTTLWRRGVELARARGCTVLSARPAQAEAAMRFTALGDFLHGVAGEDLDALATPQRTALREILLEVGREGSAEGEAGASRPVSVGFLALLKRLAGQRPAVIAVDDAQWLDEATIAVCQFAFRRLAAEPVLVLATYGTGMFGLEREPSFPCDAPEEQLTALQVAPLADDDISLLLGRRSLEGWPRSLIYEAARTVGGNPRLALELTRRSETHDRDDALVLPDWLTRWVASRLAGVSESATEALRGAAHLDAPSVDQLQRLLGRPGVPRVDELRETGLVDVAGGEVTFVHPAVAAALRESTDADSRRSLHERLAAVANGRAERLCHLALATVGHDDALARTLEAASRELEGEGDAQRG